MILRRTLFAVAALGLFSALRPGPAEADNLDRRIVLRNTSNSVVTRFYASNTYARRWQEDILGRRVLFSGQSVVINLNDGTGMCRFDFRTVLSNGAVLTRRNINICTLTSYTIRD